MYVYIYTYIYIMYLHVYPLYTQRSLVISIKSFGGPVSGTPRSPGMAPQFGRRAPPKRWSLMKAASASSIRPFENKSHKGNV